MLQFTCLRYKNGPCHERNGATGEPKKLEQKSQRIIKVSGINCTFRNADHWGKKAAKWPPLEWSTGEWGRPSFSKNSPPFYSDIIKVISIMWKGTQKYTTDCSSSSRNCSRALHQKLPLFAWGKTSLRCDELIFFVWPIRSHGEKHVKMSLMHLRMCKKVLPTIDRLTRSCFSFEL